MLVRRGHRAAESAGDTNLGTTSVAAPKAASSSTATYSSTAGPVTSRGSPYVRAKRLELLRELLPSTSTFALLVNPSNPNVADAPDTEAAANALGDAWKC
jgi:hypothetical protein